jgi:hypothetical protein
MYLNPSSPNGLILEQIQRPRLIIRIKRGRADPYLVGPNSQKEDEKKEKLIWPNSFETQLS